MSASSHIKQDPWLSQIMGKPCYNLDAKPFSQNKENLSSISKPCFIQSKAACDDLSSVSYLQDLGLKVLDTNVSYQCSTKNIHLEKVSDYHLVLAKAEHREGVKNCAYHNFIYTRYHLDPEVDQDIANTIKAQWAENYFYGQRGQKMVLALTQDKKSVAGFCQILEPDSQTRIIDLIAVDEKHRKKGLAQAMITHSLEQEEKIIVGTQVSNIPSIRCYESMGFKIFKSQYVFHYHGH